MHRKPVVMAVLVTNDFPPLHGGIQRFMSRLAHELSLRNESVTVVAPQALDSAQFDQQQQYRVIRFPATGKLNSFLAMLVSLIRARRGKSNGYTIASSWFPAGLAACLLPPAIRGRFGVLAHGTEIAPDQRGFRREIMRFVFSRTDVIIANSRFTRDLLHRAGVRKKIAVVHLGIDNAPITPSRAMKPTILSVGRLVERKGIDRVIEALPEILSHFPEVRYEIVGAGPQRADLDELAKRYGVTAHVAFLGAVDDAQLRDAYARAWCFALPVRANRNDVEGFGLVYLEAALASLPTIGGLGSGAEDAIVANETGLLVDGTSTPAIAEAIITLLANPERSTAMGLNGCKRALEQFTWRNTAAEIANLMA